MSRTGTGSVRHDVSRLGEEDLYLFNEGTHFRLYEKLGAHPMQDGTYFAVWAPNARRVSVLGDFNGWNPDRHRLQPRGSSGIWEGLVPGVGPGERYKYRVASDLRGGGVDKSDPFAFQCEGPPGNASLVCRLEHAWSDGDWMRRRAGRQALDAPLSIYELHLGSWRRIVEEGRRSLTCAELAPRLAAHVRSLGFTHVEFLPVMEHPFFGSWGYQVTGYFAPTHRYGAPADYQQLIDALHDQGIGVILDWVPSHFPGDEHGLARFDGTHLYEHADPRLGHHPDWDSCIFNYGRHEVRSFLVSSARFWLDRYHVDGLRVDAVASMLYLDYGRKPGEWLPNRHGGHENLEAIQLLRTLNDEVHGSFPGVPVIAEESTSWPQVSRPTDAGGLGFDYKWDMGWMHDTLQYFGRDPIHRRYHQGELTFRAVYAFSENFILPLSHDEVVHGKGALAGKMPGDPWQKLANLRLLLAHLYGQPGKKLLFMGGEIGQWSEWDHDGSLEWSLLDRPEHAGLQALVADLNRLYLEHPALHQRDCDPGGFEWVAADDAENSVLAFLRRGRPGTRPVLVVLNHTPQPRHGYRVGVPQPGPWREILNTDANRYGGSGVGNLGRVVAGPRPRHGRPASLSLTLPPLAALFLIPEGDTG